MAEARKQTNNNTIQESVTKELRKEILTGKYEYGEHITQEDLAKRFGVSRMPIREALRRLEFEGLLKYEPRKGVVVHPITISDVEEIYTLRSMNESLAAEKSLPFLDGNDLAQLEKILLEMEKIDLNDETIDQYSQLNEHFHKTIVAKCPWKRVIQNTEIIWKHSLSIGSPLILIDHFDIVKHEHRQIFDAVCGGDVQVLKRSIEYHIERTKRDILIKMKQKYRDLT